MGLFLIANRTFIFQDTYEIKTKFDNVAGLMTGAPVLLRGQPIGRVESIALPESVNDDITVTMVVSEQAKPLIREGTRAEIKSDGLVGQQLIVLSGGEENSPQVDEGDFVLGIPPQDLFAIADKATESAERIDSVTIALAQIMRDVQRGEGTIGKFLYDDAAYNEMLNMMRTGSRVMAGLEREADALVSIAADASAGINSIIAKVDSGNGTLGLLVNDPRMYENLLAASSEFQDLSEQFSSVTTQAEQAMNWAALGAYRFAENMEALKYNWFFKTYYERRGFYEKANFEEREKAISDTYDALEAERRRLVEWEAELRAREAAVGEGDGTDTSGGNGGGESPQR